MDSANKQTAVIAEVTQGTTPATPAFKLLRDIRVSGSPDRPATRSPERRSDRMAANMTSGLFTFPKSIELPWTRDAGTDLLWESVMCNAWSTNVLKNASTTKAFTLEEKYEGGTTDPYRRLAGCMADTATISFRTGQPGTITFGLQAMAETTATATIASATYAAPTPGLDPSTPADIVVTDCFSVASAKLVSLDMTITNNLRPQHSFGSNSPFGIGMGLFDVTGRVQIYFSQSTDYSTFMTRQTGLDLSLLIGNTAAQKDALLLPYCDVWNPDVDDPGATGDHLVTLNFMARYDSSTAAAIQITRNAT
jgi:hypothetical protein